MIDPEQQVEYIAKVQREMSRSRSMRERVRALVALGTELRPPDLWFGVIVGDDDESYHLLGTGPLDPDLVTEHAILTMLKGPGDLPRWTGGVIGDLIASGSPRIVDSITVSPDDPAVGRFVSGTKSAMAVPLYWGGRIMGWSISFSDQPSAYDSSLLAMALNNANLVLHSVARDDLFQRVEALHDQVSKQVDAVARAQRALLPQELPELDGYELAVSYRPCEAAGGDYYDFKTYADGRLGVVIADVSGHGTSAAVTMAIMRATMSSYRVSGRGPEDVVDHVNRVLCDAIPPSVFVTALFLLLDPATSELTHITCGHPLALVRRADGSVDQIDDVAGPPLGILEEMTYAPGGPVTLERGDTLFLYTDGITETFDPDRNLYGADRLEAVLQRHNGDPASTIAAVTSDLRAFAQREEIDDDQAMIALRRNA